MNSSASLTTMSNETGTRSDIAIGMNNSSKVLTANTNLEPEILSSNTRKNNLVTTKMVTTPKANPRIKFNSAASTLTSTDGVETCGNSTGDTPRGH